MASGKAFIGRLACVLVLVGPTFALAHPPKFMPIPPSRELEILDPNVDPRGYPAVLRELGIDGVERIDIPPTVLVHRYYFTGQRSFQSQLLTGGPCIVVANHPRTAERLYIDVTLPPGAPRIIYRDSSIEYAYPGQSVKIEFCCLFRRKAKVIYRDGVSPVHQVEKGLKVVGESAKSLIDRTNLPDLARNTVEGTRNLTFNAVDRANDLGTLIVRPIAQIAKIIPGASLLTSTPEERDERVRDTLIRRARDRAEEKAPVFLKTNR
jgi:hypothetical protein